MIVLRSSSLTPSLLLLSQAQDGAKHRIHKIACEPDTHLSHPVQCGSHPATAVLHSPASTALKLLTLLAHLII